MIALADRVLVAVDPGKLGHGVAVFNSIKLIAAVYHKYPGTRNRLVDEADVCVCELPQVYTHGKGKGDPNDLIDVAVSAGRFTAQVPTSYVRPGSWKGQAPKSIHHKRILERLLPGERAVLDACDVPASLRHNVIDAVGLGLWYLGRR